MNTKAISTYTTSRGNIALEVSRHTGHDGQITFSYTGKHGAGSGHGLEHVKDTVRVMLATHKGIKLVSGENLLAPSPASSVPDLSGLSPDARNFVLNAEAREAAMKEACVSISSVPAPAEEVAITDSNRLIEKTCERGVFFTDEAFRCWNGIAWVHDDSAKFYSKLAVKAARKAALAALESDPSPAEPVKVPSNGRDALKACLDASKEREPVKALGGEPVNRPSKYNEYREKAETLDEILSALSERANVRTFTFPGRTVRIENSGNGVSSVVSGKDWQEVCDRILPHAAHLAKIQELKELLQLTTDYMARLHPYHEECKTVIAARAALA